VDENSIKCENPSQKAALEKNWITEVRSWKKNVYILFHCGKQKKVPGIKELPEQSGNCGNFCSATLK
jgi:hypothetical protein